MNYIYNIIVATERKPEVRKQILKVFKHIHAVEKDVEILYETTISYDPYILIYSVEDCDGQDMDVYNELVERMNEIGFNIQPTDFTDTHLLSIHAVQENNLPIPRIIKTVLIIDLSWNMLRANGGKLSKSEFSKLEQLLVSLDIANAKVRKK